MRKNGISYKKILLTNFVYNISDHTNILDWFAWYIFLPIHNTQLSHIK